MHDEKPSKTAEFMALFRALESIRPADARIVDDPFAERFLTGRLRRVLSLAQLPGLHGPVCRSIDILCPGARTSAIARTRLIDELLCRAVREGTEQIVVLGSGFDSRAYRLPELEHVRVFEVDHPATLALKRSRLRQTIAPRSTHVRFVAVDFNRAETASALIKAGIDPNAATLFLCEGVTNYLSETAIKSIFSLVSQYGSGSSILFTYVHRDVLENPASFGNQGVLWRALRRFSEPWTFGFQPEELPTFLQSHGLCLTEDLGANDYRSLYLGSDRATLAGYEFYRAAFARRAPARGQILQHRTA